MLHSTPFCPKSFTWKFSLQWVVDLVQRLWFLVHLQYSPFTETSLEYSAVALSHGDLVVMVPQNQSLYALQQITDGLNVGVG